MDYLDLDGKAQQAGSVIAENPSYALITTATGRHAVIELATRKTVFEGPDTGRAESFFEKISDRRRWAGCASPASTRNL